MSNDDTEYPDLRLLTRDLEDVAILIKETKHNLCIRVKDLGTTLTEEEGQTYLKLARLFYYMDKFKGFDLRRKDRREKTVCTCCADVEILLVDSNFQERGQKLFRTDFIKKNCSKHDIVTDPVPNHDHNNSSPSDDDSRSLQSDSSEEEPSPQPLL